MADVAIQMWSARNEPEKLDVLQNKCKPMWACFDTWGGIRVVPEICRIIGLGAIELALPLQPLEHQAIAKIEEAVDSLGVK